MPLRKSRPAHRPPPEPPEGGAPRQNTKNSGTTKKPTMLDRVAQQVGPVVQAMSPRAYATGTTKTVINSVKRFGNPRKSNSPTIEQAIAVDTSQQQPHQQGWFGGPGKKQAIPIIKAMMLPNVRAQSRFIARPKTGVAAKSNAVEAPQEKSAQQAPAQSNNQPKSTTGAPPAAQGQPETDRQIADNAVTLAQQAEDQLINTRRRVEMLTQENRKSQNANMILQTAQAKANAARTRAQARLAIINAQKSGNSNNPTIVKLNAIARKADTSTDAIDELTKAMRTNAGAEVIAAAHGKAMAAQVELKQLVSGEGEGSWWYKWATPKSSILKPITKNKPWRTVNQHVANRTLLGKTIAHASAKVSDLAEYMRIMQEQGDRVIHGTEKQASVKTRLGILSSALRDAEDRLLASRYTGNQASINRNTISIAQIKQHISHLEPQLNGSNLYSRLFNQTPVPKMNTQPANYFPGLPRSVTPEQYEAWRKKL